ncbi:MAG TPA: A24 family peptidase [Candidatus Limnocylindria bacterium]|nr:A24 family peptidase [Candidatus Limnocylindria bacterium]
MTLEVLRFIENAVLAALLITVMYTDWRFLRIPNALTYPAMAVGVVLGALEGVPGALFTHGLVDHVAALFLAFAISYPFYAAGGLKAGDAKLLMAIGALRGINFLFLAAVCGALIGGVLAVGFIVSRRLARPAAGAAPNTLSAILKTSIPYGVALGLGGLLALALEAAGYMQVNV